MVGALSWIVLGLPLLGAVVLGLWPDEPPRVVSRALGVGPIAAGFLLTLVVFGRMLAEDADDRLHLSSLWNWIEIGDLRVDVAVQIDPLSVLMMLIITGVGGLILLYSTEYMAEDRDYRRFFAEMNFFVFSMLLLVMAGNFVFLIVGWALVGLASYLLIGYYYDRPAAVAAARKAFVINVIGDVGMVLAAVILIVELGTLDYQAVFAAAPAGLGAGSGAAEAVAVLLFVGAAAKSAQVPLHTWLPDAMEGPTPVSALIHAATMVTAGVYLIVRTHALYELAPHAADLVAVVGALTLLLAATIAIAQDDIKRVLAWSTVSQIGYMIMAAGLAAYSSAMFHLLTHAFFKALLFLSAGIVIHALQGEQSLSKMGGLGRSLGFTYAAMAIGVAAISGVPGTSGFFSKDEILAHAWQQGALGKTLWVVGVVGAALTALYMFRVLFRVFTGPERAGGYGHLHHPGRVMAVPVAVLAVLSLAGGWIQVPEGWQLLNDWLEPVLADAPEAPLTGSSETITIVASLVALVVGAGAAWLAFGPGRPRRRGVPAVAATLEQGYRFDEVYEESLVTPSKELGDVLRDRLEPGLVQGIVRGAVGAAEGGAMALRSIQTGLVRSYVLAMIAGTVALGAILAWMVTH